MRQLLTGDNARNIALLLARAPLGAYLVAGGFANFSKTTGVETFVQNHLASAPAWVPHAATEHVLRAIPYGEIVCGASLLLGVLTRFGGAGAALLMLADMLLVTGVRAATPQPFGPNVIFFGVAVAVALLGPGAVCMDAVMWNRPASAPEQSSPKRPRAESSRVRVRFANR